MGDHNISIIGSYDENGIIANLASKMPNLRVLKAPSAPDKSFFEIDELKINSLTIQAGYAHQNFIRNLADSNNLKYLSNLDYTDTIDASNEIKKDGYYDYSTFEDYKYLFESEILPNNGRFHFKLREQRLTEEQLIELQKIKAIQFLYIKTDSSKYVSHIMRGLV